MPVRPLIDSLLLYDPNRSTATANLWIAHPSPSEEAALGKLFMVVSIDTPDRLNHEIISSLQDHLKHAYYQSTEAKFALAFEQALHQTNQHLHRLVIEGVDGWVDRLHCVVGVIANGQLILSSAGSMMAYVLRRGRMHDILGPQSLAINPLKIFSNLLEGQLNDQDQLLVCTPTVLDYFSLEKLRRTMAEHTPSESVRQLETALLGSEQNIALAALIIQAEGHPESMPENVPPLRELGRPSTVAPQRSMDSLIARERATEELLTPSIWPSIRDTLSRVLGGLRRLIVTKIFHRPVRRTVPASFQSPATRTHKQPNRFGQISGSLLRGFRFYIGSLWRSVFLTIQRRRARRDLHQPPASPTLPKTQGTILNQAVAWFTHLARPQRQIIGVAVALVFLLTATIIMTKGPSSSLAGDPAELTVQIEEHLTKAEAALLYGGEETAQTQVASAAKLLAELPTRSKDDRARLEPMANRLAAVRTQLRRLVTVTNPEIIAQLAEVAPTIRPLQLYWTDDQLFSYDPVRQSGVLINTATADAPTVITNTIDTGRATTGAITKSGVILFATERAGFVELNLKTETWRPLDVTWPTGTHTVQGLSVFQNRLYALDREVGEIYRFAIGSSSLGTGVRWLKESADLKAGRGIAVDGSIYILQPNGRVEEYFNGRRGEFTLSVADPALLNPTRLQASAENTKVYLLDPAHKRMLVYDKNGKLVRQYQSSSWGSLADLAIDESTKTALILNGSTIYKITLQD